MAKITYDDKVTLNPQPSVANTNKTTASDMNEIKQVVNTNDDTVQEIINGEIYSTTEVKTNKVWIDGKPIYRKVLDITNIGVSGYQYNHNISNFGTLIDVYGSWDKTVAGKQPLTRSVPGATNEYDLGIGDVTNTNFRLHYGSNVSGVTHIYVIFEYTKTTD